MLSMQPLASCSRNALLTYRHSKKIRMATFMSNVIPKAYDLLIAAVRFWIPGVIAVVAVIFRTFVAGISPTFFTYSKRTNRSQYGDFLTIAEITDGTGFESSAAPKWVSVKLHDRWPLQHITRISYCCFPTLLDQRDKSEQGENNKRSLCNANSNHVQKLKHTGFHLKRSNLQFSRIIYTVEKDFLFLFSKILHFIIFQ